VMQVVHTTSKQPDETGVRHYRHLLHRHCYQAKSASRKLRVFNPVVRMLFLPGTGT
jgi:hypothetical protein